MEFFLEKQVLDLLARKEDGEVVDSELAALVPQILVEIEKIEVTNRAKMAFINFVTTEDRLWSNETSSWLKKKMNPDGAWSWQRASAPMKYLQSLKKKFVSLLA